MVNRLGEMRTRGLDIAAALDKAIRNGWRDIFDPKPDELPLNGERRKTVDRRYFSGTAEQVCALPEPPWSTQERAAWLDARMTGYVANVPEGYNAV